MPNTKTESNLHGFKAVVEALRLEDFPMDRHAIDYAVGDIEVENGSNERIPVSDLTDQLGTQLFASAEDVIHALRAVEKRKKAA